MSHARLSKEGHVMDVNLAEGYVGSQLPKWIHPKIRVGRKRGGLLRTAIRYRPTGRA